MRVLVCGGRDFTDYGLLYSTLINIGDITEIIHGGARGADTLAEVFANDHDIQVREFPAEWKKHGKGAGPIRNRRMLKEGNPDVVVAFPGGRGTANMVMQALQAEVTVIDKRKECD